MIFDVLKSSVHFSQRADAEASVSLSFQIVPKDREYLDIGEDYILCARGYLPMRDKNRQPVTATVHVSADADQIAHIKGERPICGYAHFFPERDRKFDSDPAQLMASVVVEAHVFADMLRANPTEAGAATLHLDIEGLEFGWEPDASHKIWNLGDETDCEVGHRRRITSFWYAFEQFWTNERSIRDEEERRTNAWLADSPDPEDRKLAADLQQHEKGDPVVRLLVQCRAVLFAILVLGVVALATR